MYVGTILQDSLKRMYRVPKVDDANELRRGDSKGVFQNFTNVDYFTTLTGIGSYHLLGDGSSYD